MTDVSAIGRPFLRIAEHELDVWPYAEWRGRFTMVGEPPLCEVVGSEPGKVPPDDGVPGSRRVWVWLLGAGWSAVSR